jgi:hypothetical protein
MTHLRNRQKARMDLTRLFCGLTQMGGLAGIHLRESAGTQGFIPVPSVFHLCFIRG